MSQNVAVSPPSRPPSSASSTASSSSSVAGAGHHQQHQQQQHRHDHSRPLPPPRLPASLDAPSIPPSPRPAATSFRSVGRAAAAASHTAGPTSLLSAAAPPARPGTAVPVVVSAASAAAAAAEVSLEAPRPDVVRMGNEYVETPFRPAAKPGVADAHQIKPSNHQRSSCPGKAAHHASKSSGQSRAAPAAAASSSASARQQQQQQQLAGSGGRAAPAAIITKQPVSFTKQPSAGRDASLSIMCDQCGRCKCESCREPQPLPSCWICKNSCLCSCESVVDYVSCLCCVKGIFYHCADGVGLGPSSPSAGGAGAGSSLTSSAASAVTAGDSAELGSNCADEPCSCGGSRRTARWTFMSAMTLMLPCLICYWPLKGCHYLCEACYARRTGQGCRCEPRSHHHAGLSSARQALNLADTASDSTQTRSQLSEALMKDSRDPEKRLLDPLGAEL